MVVKLLTFKMRSIISFTSFNLLNFFCFIPVPNFHISKCLLLFVFIGAVSRRFTTGGHIPGPRARTSSLSHTLCAEGPAVVHRTAFPDQLILYTILHVLAGLLLSNVLHSRTNPFCTPYSMCWLVYCCTPYCYPDQPIVYTTLKSGTFLILCEAQSQWVITRTSIRSYCLCVDWQRVVQNEFIHLKKMLKHHYA